MKKKKKRIKEDNRNLPQKGKFTETQAIATSLLKILLGGCWQLFFLNLNYKRHAHYKTS